MHIEPASGRQPVRLLNLWSGQDRPAESGLHLEPTWRQLPSTAGSIVASRWTDGRTTARTLRSTAPAGRYVIAVALRPVRIRLGRGVTTYDGMMPAGMVHMTEPGQELEAEFFTPCDFIHFHVTADLVQERQALSSDGAAPRGLRDLLVRDDLAAQLSRTLTEAPDGAGPLYAETVGQTILMRILALRPASARVGALPKWRLRRVQEHLAANIAEPIGLADLAAAAGLSRMHFAAQFRAATGCRPHDYLLQQRIEQAKHFLANTNTPLVEVALSVGFQTQSHFSTVFKRLVGDTPGRWQRGQRVA